MHTNCLEVSLKYKLRFSIFNKFPSDFDGAWTHFALSRQASCTFQSRLLLKKIGYQRAVYISFFIHKTSSWAETMNLLPLVSRLGE